MTSLLELTNKQPKFTVWSIYNYHGEQIAITGRNELIELCKTDKRFDKTIDKVLEVTENLIKIRLNNERR